MRPSLPTRSRYFPITDYQYLDGQREFSTQQSRWYHLKSTEMPVRRFADLFDLVVWRKDFVGLFDQATELEEAGPLAPERTSKVTCLAPTPTYPIERSLFVSLQRQYMTLAFLRPSTHSRSSRSSSHRRGSANYKGNSAAAAEGSHAPQSCQHDILHLGVSIAPSSSNPSPQEGRQLST